ncbi:hypothetical protein YDYSG_24930 [Paenibacillus tyrfis]|nr:hypothetical protein YDYSG_24930 [Paenibacillus tyrfis]
MMVRVGQLLLKEPELNRRQLHFSDDFALIRHAGRRPDAVAQVGHSRVGEQVLHVQLVAGL